MREKTLLSITDLSRPEKTFSRPLFMHLFSSLAHGRGCLFEGLSPEALKQGGGSTVPAVQFPPAVVSVAISECPCVGVVQAETHLRLCKDIMLFSASSQSHAATP